jgi:hypothetical protein
MGNLNHFLYLFRMENCKLNLNVRIPQNSNSSFVISKSVKWRNSIQIEFNPSEDIDKLNLYFILRSYLETSFLQAEYISTVFVAELDNFGVSQHEHVSKILKMCYYDFELWISDRLSWDNKYLNDTKLYYIVISFNSHLLELKTREFGVDLLEALRPIYPWGESWLNRYLKEIGRISFLEKKIETLKLLLKSESRD